MSELEFSRALEKTDEEFDYSGKITLSINPDAFAPHKVLGEGTLSFKYYADYDGVLHMKGYLSVPCEFVCDRCTAKFSKNLFLEFEESAHPISQEDAEVTYSQPRIDLDEIASTFVLTHFPSKVFCREDCKGLCPRCGANLNDGDCSCIKN